MIKRKPRYYLEKSLRRFIQEGVAVSLPNASGAGAIPQSSIIMANDSVKSPDGMFATLQYIGESRSSPFFYQKEEELWVQQAIHARYLVCFLRSFDSWEGGDKSQSRIMYTSYDAAQAFIDFVESYRGMGWSSNAVTDGTLRKVYVYQTSSDGKLANVRVDPMEFYPIDAPTPITRRQVIGADDVVIRQEELGRVAKIKLYSSSNGKIESGLIVDPGEGYSMGEKVEIPADNLWNQRITNRDDLQNKSEPIRWPTITAVGSGFTVDNQLMIEEDDYPRDDQVVERRCMIEMDISFLEDRMEKDVKTVSRYELNVNWEQSIETVPYKLELQQGGEGKLLNIWLHRQPSTSLKLKFVDPDRYNGDDFVDDDFLLEPSQITITPEDWYAPHPVMVSAKPGADATELKIYTDNTDSNAESIGRSEDIVETRIPIVITPA